jgi:hypothetical protein
LKAVGNNTHLTHLWYDHYGPPQVAGIHAQPLASQSTLLTFRIEFDRESLAPLILSANTLRVLGEKPIRVAEISRLTGGSCETSDIGWQIKPYVAVSPDPAASRGKVARLSQRGLRAQEEYQRLIWKIEKRWEERFGKEVSQRY